MAESLELVRLPGYQSRYPRQLSGGQQQRVALARAIVFRPRLLLMDEPLGALDKQLRESLQLEMRRLHADLGITFIYVTHDQEEALTMSDRVAVMNEGLIAQVGTPEDLYDRPCDRFVASFIGESQLSAGRRARFGRRHGGCRLRGRDSPRGWRPGCGGRRNGHPDDAAGAHAVCRCAALRDAPEPLGRDHRRDGVRRRTLPLSVPVRGAASRSSSRSPPARRSAVAPSVRTSEIAWSIADTVIV